MVPIAQGERGIGGTQHHLPVATKAGIDCDVFPSSRSLYRQASSGPVGVWRHRTPSHNDTGATAEGPACKRANGELDA